MAGKSIRIEGVAEASRAFAEIGDRVSLQNLRNLLAQAIDLVRQDAAARIQAGHHIKTGNLLASLQTGVSKSERIASAWTKAGTFHRHLVEFGHRAVTSLGRDTGKRVPEHPYFRPALASQRQAIKAMVTQGVKDLVEGRVTAYQQFMSMTRALKEQKRLARRAKRQAKIDRIRGLLRSPRHRHRL